MNMFSSAGEFCLSNLFNGISALGIYIVLRAFEVVLSILNAILSFCIGHTSYPRGRILNAVKVISSSRAMQ